MLFFHRFNSWDECKDFFLLSVSVCAASVAAVAGEARAAVESKNRLTGDDDYDC